MSDDLLRRIGQITVEFHNFFGYHTRGDVDVRVRRTMALGFRELYWSRGRNTADVLLVNERCLGAFRHTLEQNLVRPIRAFGRLVSRNVSAS